MRENTYDASAYKFGLLINPENREHTDILLDQCHTVEQMTSVLNNVIMENGEIVDFRHVDGLTIEEVFNYNSLINRDYIFFIMYDELEIERSHKAAICSIRNTTVIRKGDYPSDAPIDEVISNILECTYPNEPSFVQKRTRCFLERYKYGTKSKTDEHLQKNLKKNNSK